MAASGRARRRSVVVQAGGTGPGRLEPEGDATHLVFECDCDMPGHIPGAVKHLMTRRFTDRQMRHMLGDFKALAEATAPVPA